MNRGTGRKGRQRSVSRIARELEAMSLGGARARSRSRPRSRSRGRSVAFAQAAGPSNTRRRKQNGGRRGPGGNAVWQPISHFVMAKEEILATVGFGEKGTQLVTSIVFSLNKDKAAASKFGAGHLLALAQSFETVRWDYIQVEYVPEVGSTVGGAVSVGVDWDLAGAEPTTHASVTTRSPNFLTPCWQRMSMRIDTAAMTNRRWFKNVATTDPFESAPFNLVVWVSGDATKPIALGSLVLKYKVEFAGTRLN